MWWDSMGAISGAPLTVTTYTIFQPCSIVQKEEKLLSIYLYPRLYSHNKPDMEWYGVIWYNYSTWNICTAAIPSFSGYEIFLSPRSNNRNHQSHHSSTRRGALDRDGGKIPLGDGEDAVAEEFVECALPGLNRCGWRGDARFAGF